MDLKEEARREGRKLRNMSWQDRIWYIWEYYKFHFLALLLVIGLISVVATSLYRRTFTTRLSFAIVNDRSGGMSHTDTLEEELRSLLGCGPKDVIEFNEGLYATFDDSNASQYAYASIMKLTALAASGDLDILITDLPVLEHYNQTQAFQDLSRLLPSGLYERAEESLLFLPDAQGNPVPVALSLANTSLPALTGISMDPPYLAVMAGSGRTEAVLQMIQYLFPE